MSNSFRCRHAPPQAFGLSADGSGRSSFEADDASKRAGSTSCRTA